ncbi:His-Xaa-Ser system radical SAM maturase HxsC [Salinicola lusitanus]|uniref:His-Xaa-Ser system radical SAM maturase HxsC n=1 Tax=Salinicola lusitanus TaxID=1949085 RepID=UPI000DA25DE9|nr:His-Xaa-Ser system radical SAM maturase HxsC [Salinicola lusitanus]
MRKITALTSGFNQRVVARICHLENIQNEWRSDLNFIVKIEDSKSLELLLKLSEAGVNNVWPMARAKEILSSWAWEWVVTDFDFVFDGDVVATHDGMNHVHVLYREADSHHTVFLTNRCNSNCLMCSQPPTRHDDSWLIDEAIEVSRHIRDNPKNIGFTGGEPLLLSDDLKIVFDTFFQDHPMTEFDILSNGRLLSDSTHAKNLLRDLKANVTWMIPLYGHVEYLHDFVVQRYGAFDETLLGMLELHSYQQLIQVRTVLIEPVLENLTELCEFIGRNLPFVREVALMGCEPIGFALANRDVCNTDLRKWHSSLQESVRILERYRVPVVLMNMPLCVLPNSLKKYAQKSISDWKQKFLPECDGCAEQPDCSGVFEWFDPSKELTKLEKIEVVQYA